MPEQFLHGVEVVEIDSGSRPVRTVKSAVIGIVGTAHNADPAQSAEVTITGLNANAAIKLTAKTAGEGGNLISLILKDPKANTQALAVTVSGNAITASLATDAAGVVTSTATLLITAINAAPAASALVTAANGSGSTGAGVVTPSGARFLSGGLNEAFPLNKPVLIAKPTEAARLGTSGTLPAALDGVFDQAGAAVVVVRVAEGVNLAATTVNVIGSSANSTGLHALVAAESIVGVKPRILAATGFTDQVAVVQEMTGIANRLRAVVIADGPNTTDSAAITYRNNFGSSRVFVVDPWVKILDAATATEVAEPASARVAGLIARIDNDKGFWNSPSNQEIVGITGTGRPVDFSLGDANARANILNQNEVATIVNLGGFRLWGNRTCDGSFLSVQRTKDMIHDSILRSHLWAVDRNITKTYIQDVVDGVNAYLRQLKAQGAVLGGKCWADEAMNTPEAIADGRVYFNVDFTPPFPAEHVIFRSLLTNDYLTEITQ